MSIVIKKQLVQDARKVKYTLPNGQKVTHPMKPEWITIHETGNTNKGANAQAHANLQSNGNSRTASWHIQVDDKEAIQSLPFNEAGLHAGDGANGDGNRKSIAIEICVNSDGDYRKAVENAVKVTALLMKEFNIPVSKVVQHNRWSGKNCPTIMRNGSQGITWNSFIKMVEEEIKPKPVVKPVTPQPVTNFVTVGELGIATVKVDVLNIRSLPNTNSQIVGKTNRNAKFSVLEIKNGWYRIGSNRWIANTGNQYCNYIAHAKPSRIGTAVVNANVLNVRSNASLNSSVVEQIKKGDRLEVFEVKNGWLRVGVNAWVSNTSKDYTTYTPNPAPQSVQKVDENVFYRVVVGSFKDRKQADDRVNALKSKKVDSFVLAFQDGKETFFRVIAGSYNDRVNADKVIADLKKLGFESFVAIYKK